MTYFNLQQAILAFLIGSKLNLRMLTQILVNFAIIFRVVTVSKFHPCWFWVARSHVQRPGSSLVARWTKYIPED
ncbi:MAG: hypothetical protein Q8940_20910 [Bacteroidota bacterium]|nr:hypothetical protein [Bacteroidota bacterium]